MKPTDSDEYRAALRRAVASLAAVRRYAARYGLAIGVFKQGDEWRVLRGADIMATWRVSKQEFTLAGGAVVSRVRTFKHFQRAIAESLNPLG